jgi:hypothetical protein
MPEYVGNYSAATANANVKDVDVLADEGMLNFLNIYVQQTTVNAAPYSISKSWFWSRVSSVLREQFLSKLLICRPNLYWLLLLVS